MAGSSPNTIAVGLLPAPDLHPPLHRAQEAVRVLVWMCRLEALEQLVAGAPRLGIEPSVQLFRDPDQRIRPPSVSPHLPPRTVRRPARNCLSGGTAVAFGSATGWSAMSVTTSVCTKLSRVTGPLWATRSASALGWRTGDLRSRMATSPCYPRSPVSLGRAMCSDVPHECHCHRLTFLLDDTRLTAQYPYSYYTGIGRTTGGFATMPR